MRKNLNRCTDVGTLDDRLGFLPDVNWQILCSAVRLPLITGGFGPTPIHSGRTNPWQVPRWMQCSMGIVKDALKMRNFGHNKPRGQTSQSFWLKCWQELEQWDQFDRLGEVVDEDHDYRVFLKVGQIKEQGSPGLIGVEVFSCSQIFHCSLQCCHLSSASSLTSLSL